MGLIKLPSFNYRGSEPLNHCLMRRLTHPAVKWTLPGKLPDRHNRHLKFNNSQKIPPTVKITCVISLGTFLIVLIYIKFPERLMQTDSIKYEIITKILHTNEYHCLHKLTTEKERHLSFFSWFFILAPLYSKIPSWISLIKIYSFSFVIVK